MSSEYIPGLEAGANDNGELASDLSDIKKITVLEDNCKSRDTQVHRSDILDFKDQGFLLHNLMTSEECAHIIDEGEKIGFGEIKGAKRDYRSCDRYVNEREKEREREN